MVVIIDYGMGNVRSVQSAIEQLGHDVYISGEAEDILDADHIVLPGVGAFGDGMAHLHKTGLNEVIRLAAGNEKPLLGICLGMHLLADYGMEGGECSGLGLIGGGIELLHSKTAERIPHVGWNEVDVVNSSSLTDGIPSGTDFYFVHSYHFVPKNSENVLFTTPYCDQVVSAVSKNNVYGVQFHPEKSSKAGLALLNNFLKN